MAQAYHVNGPAAVSLTLPAGVLTAFGVSEDGVDIEFNVRRRRLMSDVAGSEIPAEMQEMGMDARIRMRLLAFDATMLATLLTLSDATAEGKLPTIGYLIGTNSKTTRVLINSALDTPYNFPTCVLENSQRLKLGTIRTPLDLEFYAWAFVAGSAVSAKDAVLYNHTAT